MKSIMLAFLFLLVGCGEMSKITGDNFTDHGVYQKAAYYTPPGTIDAEMSGYIAQYKAEAVKRNTTTTYSDLKAITYQPSLNQDGQELWGYCQIYGEPDGSLVSEIQLSEKLNTDVPAIIKTLIVYHELSHCLLGVQHTTHDQSADLDIMFWSSGQDQVDNASNYEDPTIWGQYLDFLFLQQSQEQTP